jgi:hypothetical protein
MRFIASNVEGIRFLDQFETADLGQDLTLIIYEIIFPPSRCQLKHMILESQNQKKAAAIGGPKIRQSTKRTYARNYYDYPYDSQLLLQ